MAAAPALLTAAAPQQSLAAPAAAEPSQSLAALPAPTAAACCWGLHAGPWSGAVRRCGWGCGHPCRHAAPPHAPCRCPSGAEGCCARGGAASGCAACRGCPCGRASGAALPCRGSCCGPCCGCGCDLACCCCGGSPLLLWRVRPATCAAAWGQERWPQPRQPLAPGWWGCPACWLLVPLQWLPPALRPPAPAAAAALAAPAAAPPLPHLQLPRALQRVPPQGHSYGTQPRRTPA